jgi:hypothetical protein
MSPGSVYVTLKGATEDEGTKAVVGLDALPPPQAATQKASAVGDAARAAR